MSIRTLFLVAVALGSSACLTSLVPGEPPTLRYFSAAPPVPSLSAQPERPPHLRLRTVEAAAHLRERMVWRSSEVEYGFYETRRWTELPGAWLAAALGRELFEARGLVRDEGLAAPVLDVVLTHFEERTGSPRSAQAALVARLFSPAGVALLERTFEAGVPLEGKAPEEVAQALSRALQEVVRAACSEVARAAAEAP